MIRSRTSSARNQATRAVADPSRGRYLISTIATLVMALAFPPAIALDTSLAANVPPGGQSTVHFRGPGMKQCPGLHALVGIRHDQNTIVCMEIDTNFLAAAWGPVDFVSAPPAAGLPQQWPATADPPLRTTTPAYSGPSMHWCGPGAVVVGYDGETNRLTCRLLGPADAARPGPHPLMAVRVDGPANVAGPGHSLTQYPFTDLNGQRSTLHACPAGWAVMGLHLSGNTFLCGLVYPPDASLPVSAIDPRDTTRAWATVGAATTGIFVASNQASRTFSDRLDALRAQGVSGANSCSSNATTIELRDRFGRTVNVARGNRAAVALAGGSRNSLLRWKCGMIQRTVGCPQSSNVLDVAEFSTQGVLMRCLTRTPAPWFP